MHSSCKWRSYCLKIALGHYISILLLLAKWAEPFISTETSPSRSTSIALDALHSLRCCPHMMCFTHVMSSTFQISGKSRHKHQIADSMARGQICLHWTQWQGARLSYMVLWLRPSGAFTYITLPRQCFTLSSSEQIKKINRYYQPITGATLLIFPGNTLTAERRAHGKVIIVQDTEVTRKQELHINFGN